MICALILMNTEKLHTLCCFQRLSFFTRHRQGGGTPLNHNKHVRQKCQKNPFYNSFIFYTLINVIRLLTGIK
jgi:hypothetical protein